jgi:hypothetical protein
MNQEEELTAVVTTLKRLRVDKVTMEYELQNQIAKILDTAGIGYEREYQLGPRNRVDFLTEHGIAIEVKKGKPNKAQVISQLERYAKHSQVKAVILCIETSLNIPKTIKGKPCIAFGLQKLWGIAI